MRNCWCQGSLSSTSRLPGFLGKTFQGKFLGRLVQKGNRTKCQCWSVQYPPSWWSGGGMCWKEHLAFFSPAVSVSGISVASHCPLPIFCFFQFLSSWRDPCVVNIFSYHLHAILPPSFSQAGAFCGSVCLSVLPVDLQQCGGGGGGGVCGVKSQQLVSLRCLDQDSLLGLCLVTLTHGSHTIHVLPICYSIF